MVEPKRHSRSQSQQLGRADGLPPIPAQTTSSNFEAYGKFTSIDHKPFSVRVMRRAVTESFDVVSAAMVYIAKKLGWFPRVEPYIGYGTGSYSRLICRTLLAPARRSAGLLVRGIRAACLVPAAHTRVRINIDGVPVQTVQVGDSETFEVPDSKQLKSSEYAISDESGYLDLVAMRELKPGRHDVSYTVGNRAPVHSTLYTIARDAKVGIISDVDDTIMVTQVPTFWRAAYNTLLLNPRKRVSVPSMSVLYSKLHEMFPAAPFFYLSTSPWNLESSIRHFIEYHGFPSGPLLLRDLDPRPVTFIPSGVEHKLEFIEQLMADFPDMKFILIGDDGQRDPTTYATISKRHPGRVIAIGIRQLRPGEAGSHLQKITGMTTTQPAPSANVPVFYGTTGVNLIHTMLPYLRNVFSKDPTMQASAAKD